MARSDDVATGRGDLFPFGSLNMPGKVWTKEKLIAKIQELHAQGVDLSPTAIQVSHSALFSSARSRSHFGSWRNAIESAGLPYDELKRVKQRWSPEEILQRIRDLQAQGHDLLDPAFKTRNRSLYLAACAHRYFGSWRRAVQAAGLDHEALRESRVWTRTRILRTIQELHTEGRPLAWAYIEQHEPGIYRAARRKENFGSWAQALQAAGVGAANSPLEEPRAAAQPVMMLDAPNDHAAISAPNTPVGEPGSGREPTHESKALLI